MLSREMYAVNSGIGRSQHLQRAKLSRFVQTEQSVPSGASPLHQLWSHCFLLYLFGHAWDAAQTRTGRVLAGMQMAWRQGELRSSKTSLT